MLLKNCIITIRTIQFLDILFKCSSEKKLGSKTYYHTVTVELPDEGGKFEFYLMPSYRLPIWKNILKKYFLRRYPLSDAMYLKFKKYIEHYKDFPHNYNIDSQCPVIEK